FPELHLKARGGVAIFDSAIDGITGHRCASTAFLVFITVPNPVVAPNGGRVRKFSARIAG
ncbi:MAG: hypothetical protein VX339_07340, partial [Pseudomonadota bacterium]|nr:hypothetical protein [Pseudomonadota bacterium]